MGKGGGSGKKSGGLAPPHVPMKKQTRSAGKISDAAFAAALDLGNKQPTINMHGGVGIPGSRKKEDVQKFTALNFKKLGTELPAILQKSKDIRGNKDIDAVRKEVTPVNRQVVYRAGAPDVHSLHVANDIAAVSNSRASKVYDYPDLAPKLDKRLQNNNAAKGKTYFDDKVKPADRHAHVGQGLTHLIAGKNDEAQKSFDSAGLTEKGRKWVHKMGTLMLAERGRELSGGTDGNVKSALAKVKGGRSFEDVFVKNAETLAPFAQRGGAKTLKK